MKMKQRAPMTASDHILHLLLTVVTCGLWAPVWIYLAWRNNVTYGPLGTLPRAPERPERPEWPHIAPDGHEES